ncbi:MAG TPA: VOC family protein [Candidatus Binatia bacterium]|jgi:catechol 2,3-dioxygenase-like lactoylglutathione lyase family enzyme|nr:VOC family protein [Candidatus Binatia bacterium]
MIKPVGLTHGHYECRSFKDTIPILEEFLAFEKVAEADGNVIMKHPNTRWLLVVHEGGPKAPDKPRLNHYGVRVATNKEVDNAREYLLSKQSEFGLVEVDKLQNRHLAHSVHFIEPGGNTWEIESYEMAVKVGMGANVSVPWKTPLPPERFPGKGFIPQALTHGTITCVNLEASRHFYTEVLGLDVVSPSRSVKPHYIKHPSTPWYVVSLEKTTEERKLLTPLQRYTLTVESDADVSAAHRWLKESGASLGVTELGELEEHGGAVAFILSDPDRNWWEVTSPVSVN